MIFINDDLKLLCLTVKEMLDRGHYHYKQNYQFNGKHPFRVPFYLPDEKLVISVDNDHDLDPKEFQWAKDEESKAFWCERQRNLTYITYDEYNMEMIKKILVKLSK